MKSAVLVLVITLISSLSWGNTYYVDKNNSQSSDSNAGTASLPWKTIQHAADTLVAGDTVNILAGTYSESVSMDKSGTASAPISYTGSGNVYVNLISVSGSYVVLNGLTVGCANAVTYPAQLTLWGDYLTANNCTVDCYNVVGARGIWVDGNHNLVTNCVVKRAHSTQAFMLFGSFHTMTKSTVQGGTDIDGIYCFGHDHLICCNTFQDFKIVDGQNHADIIQTFGDAGNQSMESYNIIFEKNLILNCEAQMFNLEQDLESANAANVRDWDVRNNVWVNMPYQGNVGIPNFRFYNNVLYNECYINGCCLAVRNLPGATGFGVANNAKIVNNIFIGPGGLTNSGGAPYGVDAGLTGVVVDYNYITGDPNAGYPARVGVWEGTALQDNYVEPHGINGGDPKFVNLATYDFHLMAGSPAIDAGATIAGFNDDFDGITRPQGLAWDMGPIEYHVSGTQPPTCSITSPTNGANFVPGSDITITAIASDVDGTVTRVDFYEGNNLIGTDSTSPYSFVWTNVPGGSYALSARATDNSNAVGVSASVDITVNVPGNQLPACSITSPANGTGFSAPANITINANASDSDGSVTNVEFYQGAVKLGSDAVAPYTYTWTNVPAGSYSLTVKAYDNVGASTVSAPVGITVSTPSASWENHSFASQNSSFTAELDATPNQAGLDTAIGLSSGAAGAYTDLACIFRFTTTNTIDARNGANYEALTTMTYTPGTSYHVKFAVRVPQHTYDIYVTPQGGSQVLLGQNYAFRTEQNGVSSLANWAKCDLPAAGSTVTNFTIGTTNPPGTGMLSGSGATGTTATVNLTTEGTDDWAHWGYSGTSIDHKSVSGSAVNHITETHVGSPQQYANNANGYSWSDGTPTVNAVANTTGIYVVNTGNSFTITVPADTTARTVKVYVGGWKSAGALTAHLSDGSASDYMDSSFSNNVASYYAVYTITYKAGSSGQNLAVKWQMASGLTGGNVTLQAATLQGGGSSLQPPRISIAPESNQAGIVQLSWQSVSGANYAVYKSTNLLTGWLAQPVTNNISGDGATKLFSEPIGSAPCCYYRIKAM